MASNAQGTIIDLSQSLDRAGGMRNPHVAPCITPGGRFWHTKRNRLLVATERLALQGLVFDQFRLDALFSEDLLYGAYCCCCLHFLPWLPWLAMGALRLAHKPACRDLRCSLAGNAFTGHVFLSIAISLFFAISATLDPYQPWTAQICKTSS